MGSRLRQGPFFSGEKGEKERQGEALDPFEAGADLPCLQFVFPWPEALYRQAVHSAPTGWARGSVVSALRVSAGASPRPTGGYQQPRVGADDHIGPIRAESIPSVSGKTGMPPNSSFLIPHS